MLAIDAVKQDMESTKIMDRLICGDVGYGKTEVAIRAAFKAVQEQMCIRDSAHIDHSGKLPLLAKEGFRGEIITTFATADPVSYTHLDVYKRQVLYFSSKRKLDKGIYLDDGNIIYRNPDECLVCNVKELKLLGVHNYENVMAAVAMAAAYGVPMDSIRKTIKEFAGVEHRIEFVAEKNGVAYYNDSKGTNPDAAIRGIQAMNRPTYLIGGGYDKPVSYTHLDVYKRQR